LRKKGGERGKRRVIDRSGCSPGGHRKGKEEALHLVFKRKKKVQRPQVCGRGNEGEGEDRRGPDRRGKHGDIYFAE